MYTTSTRMVEHVWNSFDLVQRQTELCKVQGAAIFLTEEGTAHKRCHCGQKHDRTGGEARVCMSGVGQSRRPKAVKPCLRLSSSFHRNMHVMQNLLLPRRMLSQYEAFSSQQYMISALRLPFVSKARLLSALAFSCLRPRHLPLFELILKPLPTSYSRVSIPVILHPPLT
jgi:hypothetical protein